MQRNDVMETLIENGNFKKSDIARSQGYVKGIDTYLELETELDRYRLYTEADKKREQMFNSTVSITSQAEAMGII